MNNVLLQTHMLLPIEEIARKLSLLPAEYEPIGAYGAKLNLNLLDNPAFPGSRQADYCYSHNADDLRARERPWSRLAWRRGWSGSGASRF